MKLRILQTVFVMTILFIPALVTAECTQIGAFTRFALERENTVLLYYVNSPVVRFDVQSCEIQPWSSIQILHSYMCDGDQLVIDGLKCVIMEIQPLGP